MVNGQYGQINSQRTGDLAS